MAWFDAMSGYSTTEPYYVDKAKIAHLGLFAALGRHRLLR